MIEEKPLLASDRKEVLPNRNNEPWREEKKTRRYGIWSLADAPPSSLLCSLYITIQGSRNRFGGFTLRPQTLPAQGLELRTL